MNSFISSSVIFFLVLCTLTSGFVPQSKSINVRTSSVINEEKSTKLFFFGKPKDDGSPGDYLCKDCGYVFTKGPAAWAKLDERTYKCPPCGAPKFRFKKVPKGSSKNTEKKKDWFGN